jgi:hypothetical protein
MEFRADHGEHTDFGAFTEVAPLRIASARTYTRRPTRQLHVGKVPVGGSAPISVQSMTKTDTRDVQATVDQIWALEAAGCEIVRVVTNWGYPGVFLASAFGRAIATFLFLRFVPDLPIKPPSS